MRLPEHLTLRNCAYVLDGGTTCLHATDSVGQWHGTALIQHMRPEGSHTIDAIPGRLYFDGELVEVRSPAESQLLQLLRTADVDCQNTEQCAGDQLKRSPTGLILGDDIRKFLSRSLAENIHALRCDMIAFVESEQYLRFADQVDQTADKQRYTVWVPWSADDRKRVVVGLALAERIGVRAARELLEQHRPVAKDLSAVEVVALAARYRTFNLDVRVEPVFRWALPHTV